MYINVIKMSLGRFFLTRSLKPCLFDMWVERKTVDHGFQLNASNLRCDITEIGKDLAAVISSNLWTSCTLWVWMWFIVILWDCSEHSDLQHVKQSRKKAGRQGHAWIGEKVRNIFAHISTSWNQCVTAPVPQGAALSPECPWHYRSASGCDSTWNSAQVNHGAHATHWSVHSVHIKQ